MRYLLVAFLLMNSARIVMAQGPPPPPPLNEVPMDGFSALLLAAGAGYGAYRVKDKRQRQ